MKRIFSVMLGAVLALNCSGHGRGSSAAGSGSGDKPDSGRFDFYACQDKYYDAIDDCHERGDCAAYRKPQKTDKECNVYAPGFSATNLPKPYDYYKCLDAYYDAIDDCQERNDCDKYKKPSKSDKICDYGQGPVNTDTIGTGGTDNVGPIHTPTPQPEPPAPPASTGTASIRIASYNVDNLFDTLDDANNDTEFLPANGWSEAKLNTKLDRIKQVVLSIDKGKLPDILVIVEVENANVMGLLASRLGYKNFVISEGPDKRGIDTAILYSGAVSLVSTQEHPVPIAYPTRNIFEANFTVGAQKLTLFSNHWPSQKSPNSDRAVAARLLQDLINGKLAADPKNYVVATGDFNVLTTEEAVAIIAGVTRDIHTSYLANHASSSLAAPGTYFYRTAGQWNLFDRFFVSPNLRDGKGLDVNLDTYAIVAPAFARESTGAPFGFDANLEYGSEHGYSDHYPVTCQLIQY